MDVFKLLPDVLSTALLMEDNEVNNLFQTTGQLAQTLFNPSQSHSHQMEIFTLRRVIPKESTVLEWLLLTERLEIIFLIHVKVIISKKIVIFQQNINYF